MKTAYATYVAPPEVLTEDEASRIYIAASANGAPYRVRNVAQIALMHRGGCRKGEVLRLAPERVWLDSETPRVEIRDSKFGKGRNVPLDARAVHLLRAWESIRPDSPFYFCTVMPGVANVVSHGNPVGSRLSHAQPNGVLKRAAVRAGVQRRVWPHMLRHTAASNWIREGMSLEVVRRLLGHVSIVVTQRYVHASDLEVERAVYGLSRTVYLADGPHVVPVLVEPAAVKVCGMCAEEIKAAARICRWCRSEVA